MSAYPGYPQGHWPGGHDEGRGWAARGTPPDGWYSELETDPHMTSKADAASLCGVAPGGGDTFKQRTPYAGRDFTDEGRAWAAPGTPSDGRYSKLEADPLMTSKTQFPLMSRVMPDGGDTFKQPAPYAGRDSTGISRRKRTCFDTGGLPVKGQGQNADWRCVTHGGDARAYESPKSVAPAQPPGSAAAAIPARPARPAYAVPQKMEPPNRKLRISGLAVKTPGYKLMSFFSRWGVVEDIEVVKDLTLRSTGVAFVIFEKLGDAVKAVSDKPHVIDDKEVEVTYAKEEHMENLPSEIFLSWREHRHCESVQQQRLPDSIKSMNQGYDPSEAREPQRLLEDAQPRRLTEGYQPRRQSTPDPLMSQLTQADSVLDMPLVTEYECNVSGCLFKGKSEQFESHWTKIHQAKVLYLICSFCSMECMDASGLCDHLDFFHGIEDRSELLTFLLRAKQQERDNVQFIMPGSVTRETCMKVTNAVQKNDTKDVLSCTQCRFTGTVDEFVDHFEKYHSSGLNSLRCPKCPKTFKKRDFLLLHIKYQHQNKVMRTEKQPENTEKKFEESPNHNLGRSLLERICHELQRQELPRSETNTPTISDIDSMSAGNRSMQTMPRASLSAPLQSGQNVLWPESSQQTTPPVPQLQASHVPSQEVLPLQGHTFYPSTASVPKPVPPPLSPPPLLTSPPLPQPVPLPSVGSQSYPPLPVPWFSNKSVVAAVSSQADTVASPHTQVVASVAPSVVPPPSPQAGVPLQLPLTGQMITQSASAEQLVMEQPPFDLVAPSVVPPPSSQTGAPFQHPLTEQMITDSASAHPPEFVLEQLSYVSQSIMMPSEDHSSIPEVDAQDVNDFDMDSINTQEMSPESESEPEMVTEEKANNELKRSVSFGSVLALRPEWTKSLNVVHPKTSSLEENTCEKNCSFTNQVKFIPKFDRTQRDSIHKFLLWSHIMMERLEDANIEVRRRLEAGVAEGDYDEDAKEILNLPSDERTGVQKRTAVKGTFSQAHGHMKGTLNQAHGHMKGTLNQEHGHMKGTLNLAHEHMKGTMIQAHESMKARVQTVAERVFTEYRSMNNYTVASNRGQSGNGEGKQGLVDKKVLGQLFHKAIGMIKYLSKRANVDADIVRKGVSWVKRDIRRMLEQERTGNGDWSKNEHQHRTDNHDLIRDEHQRWTDNFGWSMEEFPDLQMHDRSQEQFFEERRFSQEEYLDNRDDDRISFSNFDDGGSTKPPEMRGKKRKRSRRGKSSSTKTEIHEEVDTKTKDQMIGGKKRKRKRKRKAGDKTEGNKGNTFEQEQDGISGGGFDTKTKDQMNSGKKNRRKRKGGSKTEGNKGITFEQEQDGNSDCVVDTKTEDQISGVKKRKRKGGNKTEGNKGNTFEEEQDGNSEGGVDTKTKDQMNSGKKSRRKRKGGSKTERDKRNACEQEQDGISEGDLSGDGSLCEFDVDDVG